MAVPFVIPLITVIGTTLLEIGNVVMQAIRTLGSIPWKRVFWWAVLSAIILYFSGVIYSLVTVSVSAMRLVFGSSNMASGRPSDVLGGVGLSFSSFWSGLSIPPFWRFFMWFCGFDWFLWLAVSGIHFWLVGYLLGRFAKPIGTLLHKALEAL